MIKLFACGDVVNFSNNENFVDEKIKNKIGSCDFSICNFEAPIEIDNMAPINKAGPHIFQSKNSIKYLKDVGFNIVSLANNHIYDFGQDALNATINELNNNNIDYIGAGSNFDRAYEVNIISKESMKIGLVAACENEFGCLYEEQNRGGYAWLFHPLIEDNIRHLKKTCNSVVLIAHAGVEGIEIPIKEWRDRYKRLCDIGVDVVVGHHPHIPQGIEKYDDSIIFTVWGISILIRLVLKV